MLISGIGTAVPTYRIHQADAALIAEKYACENEDQANLFRYIYRNSGVETRHGVVLETSEGDLESRQTFYADSNPTTLDRMRRYEEAAVALAFSAAQKAIRDAGIDPARITHVITVSCSGFFAPGVDVALIKRLGLSRKLCRTHVGFMGCHGMLNGLRVATAYLDQDPRACILLVALEICSLHHQYGWNVEHVVANALFADGAAALVGVASEPISESPLRVVASGSQIIDDSESAMSWRIGNHGFVMTLSQRIPELIAKNIRAYLDEWLREKGLDASEIGSWAVHPGGPRILAAFEEAMGFDRERLRFSYDILSEYGNMSSPTVFFIIERMRRQRAPRPIVALGFGPGLAVEAALLA
jgi:predicted naringenin-chalcone synthase